MKSRPIHRRALGLAVFVSALGLIAASCVPQPAPSSNFSFRATSVTAVDQTEYMPILWACGFASNCYDEPYNVNIWFRVKIGVAGSADAGVVSARSASPEPAVCKVANQETSGEYCTNGTETAALTGAQQAQVTFNAVTRPDVLDLANPANKIEVVGVWSWAMEEDLIGSLTPDSIAAILESALNATLAVGSVPSDMNDLAQIIIDNLGSAIAVGGSALLDVLSDFLFGAGDDLIGSRMYVFVGSRGTLAGIINAASIDLTAFNLNVSSVGIPDIDGVAIRSTSAMTFTDQAFVGSGADHRYTYSAS